MTIERIIFAQGEDAVEFLDLLDSQGEQAAVDALSMWHYFGEHETADEPAAGTSDTVFETEDGYILTYNIGLGYIGLEFRSE